jgi:hypothetical protein
MTMTNPIPLITATISTETGAGSIALKREKKSDDKEIVDQEIHLHFLKL